MPKKILILFDKKSDEQGFSNSARFGELFSQFGSADIAYYSDLIFDISSGATSIFNAKHGVDLDAYDVVYLRRIGDEGNEALSAAHYCFLKGVKVVDREFSNRPGSQSKLIQYLKLSMNGVRIPRTIYSLDRFKMLEMIKEKLTFPIVLKTYRGVNTRGVDNYLVKNINEAEHILVEKMDEPLIAQEFIPNSRDYRVFICGDNIPVVIERSRAGDSHLNNTSQGAAAKIIEVSELPASSLELCKKAAKVLDRDIAGVDLVFYEDDFSANGYILEVNRGPQIEGTAYDTKSDIITDLKMAGVVKYLTGLTNE